jgi:hypothetical protein
MVAMAAKEAICCGHRRTNVEIPAAWYRPQSLTEKGVSDFSPL